MIKEQSSSARWSNYFLRRGKDFESFWKDYLEGSNHDVLFMLAQGFDLRMCSGVEALSLAGGSGKRDCVIIELDEGASSPSRKYRNLVDANNQTLSGIFPEGKKTTKHVSMVSTEGRRIGSRNVANAFTGIEEFSEYTDIIIDVSSMPRSIFFPLVGRILHIMDTASAKDQSPSARCRF